MSPLFGPLGVENEQRRYPVDAEPLVCPEFGIGRDRPRPPVLPPELLDGASLPSFVIESMWRSGNRSLTSRSSAICGLQGAHHVAHQSRSAARSSGRTGTWPPGEPSTSYVWSVAPPLELLLEPTIDVQPARPTMPRPSPVRRSERRVGAGISPDSCRRFKSLRGCETGTHNPAADMERWTDGTV